jgi:hypothetical protein
VIPLPRLLWWEIRVDDSSPLFFSFPFFFLLVTWVVLLDRVTRFYRTIPCTQFELQMQWLGTF